MPESKNGILPTHPDPDGLQRGDNPFGFLRALTALRGWAFAHSLWDHGGNIDSKIPIWLNELANAASFSQHAWKGAFGQARDQAIPPGQVDQLSYFDAAYDPSSRNTYDPWPETPASVWATGNWSHIFVMASNFEQRSKTPVVFADEFTTVLNYVVANAPTAKIIILEHISEPAMYDLTVFNTNELSAPDFSTWLNTHAIGGTGTYGEEYHTWHKGLQDELISRGYPVTMVPSGPIFSELLLNEAYLSSVTYQDLMADDSPHGFPSAYLLYALVVWQAVYRQLPDPGFTVKTTTPAVLSAITSNMSSINTFIANRLPIYEADGVVLP